MKKICSKSLWADSFSIAVAIIAGVETLCAISDFGLKDFCVIEYWWEKLSIIVVAFLFVWVVIVLVKFFCSLRTIKLKFHNTSIIIKYGDLFKSNDWKVIPCNEFFDTQVDDVIIAHNSLNGQYIDKYVKDINDLQETIRRAPRVHNIAQRERGGKVCHQLGRIITYDKYMLLAFAHFDENNQATLTHNHYEACLRTMWDEISRTYANLPVSIPLLGGGITRFENPSIKNDEQLLKCILCTLRLSNAVINQPITIYLTKSALKKINLYELKKQFK